MNAGGPRVLAEPAFGGVAGRKIVRSTVDAFHLNRCPAPAALYNDGRRKYERPDTSGRRSAGLVLRDEHETPDSERTR